MATILDLVKKHNALTNKEILYFQRQYVCAFIEYLLMDINEYPKLYTVLEEYYHNNPKKINNIGTYGNTPLFFASSSQAMVKFLLDNGANINYKNCHMETVLHHAINFGHFKSIKVLCEYGANVHIKNIWGETPIDKVLQYINNHLLYDCSKIILLLLLKYDGNTNKKYRNLDRNISLLIVLFIYDGYTFNIFKKYSHRI